jgi:hypothetical protein
MGHRDSRTTERILQSCQATHITAESARLADTIPLPGPDRLDHPAGDRYAAETSPWPRDDAEG